MVNIKNYNDYIKEEYEGTLGELERLASTSSQNRKRKDRAREREKSSSQDRFDIQYSNLPGLTENDIRNIDQRLLMELDNMLEGRKIHETEGKFRKGSELYDEGNNLIFEKAKNDVFVYKEGISFLPMIGIEHTVKYGKDFVNGIEWTGRKISVSLIKEGKKA